MRKGMMRADERPRVYLRVEDGAVVAAASEYGPGEPITSLHAAIDSVAGKGASSRPAVLFWLGDEQGD